MIPDYSQVSLQDPPDNNWKLTLTSADLLSDQPKLASPVRFERTTTELTARCSTIELQRNKNYIIIIIYNILYIVKCYFINSLYFYERKMICQYQKLMILLL